MENPYREHLYGKNILYARQSCLAGFTVRTCTPTYAHTATGTHTMYTHQSTGVENKCLSLQPPCGWNLTKTD